MILKVICILGLLILAGLIYRLAWQLQSLLTPVEQAVANARQAATDARHAAADAADALATAVAVLEAVTAPVDEPADEPDEPDTDEYPAYVLVDNCAADVHPAAPTEPAAPDWADSELARFSFTEGHQR